jgi:integrase
VTASVVQRRARQPTAAGTVIAGPGQERCPGHAAGPHDLLAAEEILVLLPRVWGWAALDPGASPGRRLRGAARILAWLATWPGAGWQQRWLAAGADDGLGWIEELSAGDRPNRRPTRGELTAGLNWLILARVLRPGYDFFTRYKAYVVFAAVPQLVSPDLFARITQGDEAAKVTAGELARAQVTLVKLVLHTGKDLEQLVAADLFEFRAWNRGSGRTPKGLHAAWDLLRGAGVLPADTSLRATSRRGQRPIPELVDSYGIRSRSVRAVLIRYLTERRAGLDYNSLRGLVGHLAGRFWSDIERHHPGIDSLHLPEEVALAWKERLMLVGAAGQPGARARKTRFDVLIRVRAFYLDIHEWAHTDPSWAQWAVPSPVRRGDTEGVVKARRQVTTQMHQRIRERLPQLPVLVETAERHRIEQRALLEAGSAVAAGDTFTHRERFYRRVAAAQHPRGGRYRSRSTVVAQEQSTGEKVDITRAEDDAFWSWAIIETLRHTGVRLEELLEITHLALVSYRLPDTAEVVPLLQIVPSKSNAERLLLVSPELASVLAAIITRLRRDNGGGNGGGVNGGGVNGGTVPLVARYDPHERVAGPLLPHLFQRRVAHRTSVIAYSTVRRLLNDAVERTGLRDAAGEPMNYTAHDFRRMFVTEAVTGGLPVHIAARVLGHYSLNTTQAYLAVFQDDLIRAYRGFLDTRRAMRPQDDYREPTDAEWQEFQQHFELRKLELGTCGRPYATPCPHEHACIRCPMLRVDPAQRARLVEIIGNLGDRIAEARANGWHGEVQGLRTSLDAATKKLASLDRTTARGRPGPTDLGLPATRPAR